MGIFGFGRKGAAAQPPAALLTLAEYATHFAGWIPHARPGTSAEVVVNPEDDDDRWVSITTEDDRSFVAYVDNFYRRYLTGQATPEELFSEHLEAALFHLDDESTGTLMPLLKPQDWLAGIAKQSPDAQMPLTKPLVGELFTTYVLDRGGAMQFLSSGELSVRGQTLTELHAEAVGNLAEHLGGIKANFADGIFMLESEHGTYDATFALFLDQILPQLGLTGSPIIALPARDALLVADSAVDGSVEHVSSLVAGIFSSHSYALTDQLYDWDGERLHVRLL